PQFNNGQGIEIQDARENIVGELRPKLLRLLGAVLFVLLIACANVANLLLARAADRGKEIAVRTAMGASRLKIIRQLLIESLTMALLGGALALLLVRWSLTLLLAFIPLKIPGFIEISVDGPVLAFVLLVALVTSILVGLVPALYSSRPNLSGTLKEGGGRGSTESRVSRQTRNALVVADVALALILLIGAGLMIRSLAQIRGFDAGVRPENLLTLTFEPPDGTPDARRLQIKQQVLDRAAALPGVSSAALTSHILYDRGYLTQEVTVDGHQIEDPARVQTYYVSQGYFQTLGIPVEAGRGFMPQDNTESAAVAIVNRAFADRYWSGDDPIGKRIQIGKAEDKGSYLTIVGVVGNVRTKIAPGTPDQPIQMYLPGMRSTTWGYNLVVSTEKEPTRMTSSLRQAIQQIDPGVSMYNVDTLRSRMANVTSDTRFFTGMMGVFAGLALILAVLGIYGLISYTVSQQKREIAVRMALGAMSGDILRMMVVRGLILTLAGLGIGLAAAFALSQSISKFLFGVSQTDALTFLGMPVILGLTALIACWLPARRAIKVDPLTSLRYD
ncbi:MAG TPA: ADOP family duplicated permease, partial [Thermoanaerobaculia bacterium]|nr:ADOP family duplicated permease [Thermoanaerobaculia bacterium]